MRMRTGHLTLLILAGLGASFLGWRMHSSADDRVRPIPDTVSVEVPAVSPPLMMETKLTASQRVLEKIGLERRGERAFPHPAYVAEGPMAWFEREKEAWLAACPR